MPQAWILQHVPFEGPGAIAPWLEARGYSLGIVHCWEGDPFPEPESVDFLVIMGGPMSVNDEAVYPWLVHERHFVAAVIALDRPVLGVCLGAQMIARALGAEVYPNAQQEIGWFPIQGCAPVGPEVLRLPALSTVLHWHGETFDLPRGAHLLARSEACVHQAFQWGRAVVGLQFHIESTPQSVAQLVEHDRDSLRPAAWVQPAEVILAAPDECYRALTGLLGRVLEFLHRTRG